jgi:TolB-like protein
VAIGDFDNNTDEFHLDSWEKSIPEFLKSELSPSNNLIIVERRELESVLQEQALSMSGLVDSATAQKVGSILGAAYIIGGAINKAGSAVRIDAKIIKTSSGQVRSEKILAPDDQYLSEMTNVLGNNINFILTGEGAYIPKQRLKKYPTLYFLLGTVGLGTATFLVNDAYWKKVEEYRNAQVLDEIENKYNSANTLNTTRIVLASLTGAAVFGTLYCWINDMSADELIAQDRIVYVPSIYMDGSGGIYASLNIKF